MANNTTLLYSHPENTTGAADFLLRYPNEVLLDGAFGPMLLAAVFVIVFGSTVENGVDRAFIAGSFVTLIAATVLAALGVIASYLWALAAISLVVALVNSDGGGRGV